MWFTNLQIYRLTRPFDISPEALSDKLAEHAFTPCHSQQPESIGWVPPIGDQAQDYVHAANGRIMICARQQERILPAAVLNEQLDEKVRHLEQEESRKVSRKEKKALKDELFFDLLPRAFTRSRRQYAYIDPARQLIVVNSASASRAETLLNTLRETLGSLAVIPLATKSVVGHTMTHWLAHADLPDAFSIGSECELKDMQQQGGVIRCKHQDLLAEQITAHLDSGMMVSKLQLLYKDRIDCLVDEKLAVRRLKFTDLVMDAADSQQGDDDAASRFDADFVIMTVELGEFIDDLVKALGGVDSQAEA